MARILAVGGAGYVGSSVSAWLIDRGHDVWVLDDLSTGYRDAIQASGFTHARAGDRAAVRQLLKDNPFDCVMHFAARAVVEESVRQPKLYFENNVEQVRTLVDTMLECGVSRLVFSSTCAIFGDPGGKPITEDFPRKPMSPYGESKVLAEAMLEEMATKRGLLAISLRYFNAAGAEPKLRAGEWHHPETHVIPRALSAGLRGDAFEIFGTDYETPDGSCVRDFVHVADLAQAHEAAMLKLLALPRGTGGGFEGFNLGSERGHSVREIVRASEAALGREIRVAEKPRRPGDPPILVADSSQARVALGFRAARSLDEIVSSALQWERQKASRLRRAVFLDRDGTLNHDPGYLSDPAQLKIFGGVPEALAELKRAGFLLVVVSNQSGVGRGLIRPRALEEIHERLGDALRPAGASIDHYELCLHRPEDECDCRKPSPKLLLDSAAALGIDVARSYMIGDKGSDVRAGRAAGCRGSLLMRTGEGREAEKTAGKEASFVADGLRDAVKWILDQENGP